MESIEHPPLAIDVVLLPPTQVMELVLQANVTLQPDPPFRLNLIDRLPHLSLAMGYLPEDKRLPAKWQLTGS